MSVPNFSIELIQLIKADLNDVKNTFAGKAQLIAKLDEQVTYLTSEAFTPSEKEEINKIFANRKIILRLA